MFLDSKNAILHENLGSRILEGKREACELNFCDFDDVRFQLKCDASSTNIVKLNICSGCYEDVVTMGAKEKLEELFPGFLAEPDEGFDVALEFDLDTLADGPAFLNNISNVKKHILGAPIEVAFRNLESGTGGNTEIQSFSYRENEPIFVCPKPERVVVIMLLKFKDQTDRALARVFLQEFVEAKRQVTGIFAPNVSYSKGPPTELIGHPDMPSLNESSGFILFQFEKKAISGHAKDTAVHLLTGFRTYIMYHIKATKTYLHMRMRKRVNGWMQVLNRAKPTVDNGKAKPPAPKRNF